MSTVAVIDTVVRANTAQFTKAMKDAQHTTEELGKKVRATSAQSGRGFFGGANELNKSLKLLVGGGALAGATVLARKVGEAADKAWEMKRAFDAGEISAGELAGEITRTIPLLGDVVRMWDSILHGQEMAEIAQQKANAATADKLNQMALERAEQAKLVGLKGDERALLEEQIKLEKDIAKIRDASFGPRSHAVNVAAALAEKAARQLAELNKMEIVSREPRQRQAAIDQMAASLKEEFETIGMTNVQLRHYQLTQLGATQAELAAIQAKQADIDALNKIIDKQKEFDDSLKANQERLKSVGESLRESLREPGEILSDTLGEISELLLEGAIDFQTFERAAQRAFDAVSKRDKDGINARAEQVNLSRTFIPGISGSGGIGKQTLKTKDPQLEQTNKTLRAIERNTSRASVAVAA